MSAAVFDCEVVVTRREWTPPPAFRCVACELTIEADRWRDMGRAPVCAGCVRHWSTASRLPHRGVTRGDMKAVARLDAIVNRFTWEVMDGRRFAR